MTSLPPAGRRAKKKAVSRGVFVPGALLDPGQVFDDRVQPMVLTNWEDGGQSWINDPRPGGLPRVGPRDWQGTIPQAPSRPYDRPLRPPPGGGGRVNLVDLGVLSAYLARLNSTRRV